MNKSKPYSIHFIILVFGQVISIVGNSIVSFVLSLYLLEETGSAAVFGAITALTAIPWAICGPLGGVLADKFSKKNIMVILDFFTATVILSLALIGFEFGVILTIGVINFIFAIIQSMYSPCVSSSLVFLVQDEYLPRANAIVSQINSVARILGPILAGILFAVTSIQNILLFGAATFFICAIIECFMKIPKASLAEGSANSTGNGIKASFKFLIKDNKYLFLFLCFVSLAGMCINSVLSIGLPYVVNIYLDMPSQFYGIASGVISAGSFAAGILIWLFPTKITFARSGYIYVISGITLTVIGVSLYLASGLTAFTLLCITSFILMISHTALYIILNTFIQRITPNNMLGKVMSCVVIISGFTSPSGQVIYGSLFDLENISPSIIILVSGIFVAILSYFALKFSRAAENHASTHVLSTKISTKTTNLDKIKPLHQ